MSPSKSPDVSPCREVNRLLGVAPVNNHCVHVQIPRGALGDAPGQRFELVELLKEIGRPTFGVSVILDLKHVNNVDDDLLGAIVPNAILNPNLTLCNLNPNWQRHITNFSFVPDHKIQGEARPDLCHRVPVDLSLKQCLEAATVERGEAANELQARVIH